MQETKKSDNRNVVALVENTGVEPVRNVDCAHKI